MEEGRGVSTHLTGKGRGGRWQEEAGTTKGRRREGTVGNGGEEGGRTMENDATN